MSLLFNHGDLIQSILQLFNYNPIHFKTARFDQFKTDPTFYLYRHYNRPSISLFSYTQIVSVAGCLGNQGIVMISPQTATIKPAPALIRTSRTGITCPVGAPRKLGSVEKLYWVFAMQTGRWPYP